MQKQSQNEADSVTVTAVYSATENKNSNEFTQPLTITGWTYGETANTIDSRGKILNKYIFRESVADWNITRHCSDRCGNILCKKQRLKKQISIQGLESDAVEFVIEKKITNDNITKIADQTYTGEEIKPVIEVKKMGIKFCT